MKRSLAYSALVAFLPLALSTRQAVADVTLPKSLSSHMVLQRDRPLPIWGWADPGEEITVKLDEATATAKADAQGNWKVVLPAVKADGKAHALTVGGKNTIELDDILFGDVWIGSGQSNMRLALKDSRNGEQAAAEANDPQIRLLHVTGPKKETERAKDVDSTGWKVCTPQTAAPFSAVLYFFGQRLRKEIDVPIGLIASAVSGTPIEAWMPPGGQSVNAQTATATPESPEVERPDKKQRWRGESYNGMIAPLHPLAIRGVLWYQGETNVNQLDGLKYFDKMKALIDGWRKGWGYDFPFYFVEIAPFWKYRPTVPPPVLPPLWEAQVASLKIPGTGMAVTTDLVDDIKDIHPKNKFDVGDRLALWALAKVYGKKDSVYSGPLYKSMKVEGDKIRLTFAHVGGGLKARDDKPLAEFEIAGADGKFVPATATIDGGTVVVGAKQIASPTQARFGWRNEANPNLANKEGLPASPFQTDNWQGGAGE